MQIEDKFQESTDKVMDDRAARPPPERTVEPGVDLNETLHQTKEFAAVHYIGILSLILLVVIAIAARRSLRLGMLSKLTSGAKALAIASVSVAVIVASTLFFGPKGGAMVGGVIAITAFNWWRYPRK